MILIVRFHIPLQHLHDRPIYRGRTVPRLPLPLLLRRNHLESRSGLLFATARRALLRNFAPPTTVLALTVAPSNEAGKAGIGRGLRNDALVGKLATTYEFIRETSSIKSRRVSVDCFGEYFRL